MVRRLKMHKILVIEDEPDMQFILSDNMESEGYEVEVASNGRRGAKRGTSGDFSLIILDIMLPDLNGIEVCKTIRSRDAATPIIMLTARGDEIDKVVGLEVGADDYVTKPFSMRELQARVKAHLRRAANIASPEISECVIGDATADLARRELVRGDKSVKLTRYENDLLRFLAENRGRVVSRQRIIDEVWNGASSSASRTIDNYVARLRSKVESSPSLPRHILTVHGEGYKLV